MMVDRRHIGPLRFILWDGSRFRVQIHGDEIRIEGARPKGKHG